MFPAMLLQPIGELSVFKPHFMELELRFWQRGIRELD